MITREVVILAGGLGTRLKPLVSDRPKPMAEINGRPFLEYLMDYLILQGMKRIILSVGYLHDSIRLHFGPAYKQQEVVYAVESTPLGTGGGLRNALGYCSSAEVFVVNGDTYFPVPLILLENKFIQKKADLVMALHQNYNTDRFGTIVVDETGRILQFSEKNKKTGLALINGGIYLMKRDLLEKAGLADKFSFERDFLEKQCSRMQFYSVTSDAEFMDIGIPEALIQAGRFFDKGAEPLKNKALFLDRDGTINVEKNYVFRIEDFEFREGIFDLVNEYYTKGYLIFVITNQAGIARGLYTEEDLKILNGWMVERFRQKGIVITEVRHCPHHPEITGECGCRKPKPGMIQALILEYGLDRSECVLIGDKMSDVQAGLNAGVRTNYLISETGRVTTEDVIIYKG